MQKQPDEELILNALTEKLPPHFDYLEKILGENEFFVGNSLTLADIAFSCQLINMEHGGEQIDAQRWPNLTALYNRIKSSDTTQNMLEGEQQILNTFKTG